MVAGTRERAEGSRRGDRRLGLNDSDGGRAHTEISGPGVVFDDGALELGKPG
jgi:hypothetical protein